MSAQTKRLNVVILCGGRSAEHEVSIISARNILRGINRKKYSITLIHIDQHGQGFMLDEEALSHGGSEMIVLTKESACTPLTIDEKFFIQCKSAKIAVDVVFPVLHGTYGEDGTMQGLLKMFNAPFVGPDVLGSAVGMDKDVSKRLLRDAGIPIVKFFVFHRKDKHKISFIKIKRSFGVPFFVKPARLGSSIGISKVTTEKELMRALRESFRFDHKILIEEAIVGKEIEVAVLGNEHPRASIAGEIIPTHDFYSYDAKYVDENGAYMAIPAHMPHSVMIKIQKMAIQTFETLCCEGMGRVDFFLTDKNEIFVNEINTIPGFTSISMYPKLWELSGITYTKLIDILLTLAMVRHKKERRLHIHR